MTSTLPETPYLACKTPDNKEFIIPLKTHFQDHQVFTFGRSNENDFPINDPQKFISREHCRLTSRTEYIWIYDDDGGAAGEASQSGTFVSSVRNPNQEIDVRKEGNKGYRLRDGDTFYFVGKVDDENISYWEFTLRETQTTRNTLSFNHPNISIVDSLKYSLSLKSLVKGSNNEIIKLSANRRKLISYMAQKNLANSGKATLCLFEELIDAVWGEDFSKTSQSINHLVLQIRKCVKDAVGIEPSDSKYIESVAGSGYILNIDLVD